MTQLAAPSAIHVILSPEPARRTSPDAPSTLLRDTWKLGIRVLLAVDRREKKVAVAESVQGTMLAQAAPVCAAK